jgi:hypothetical protein
VLPSSSPNVAGNPVRGLVPAAESDERLRNTEQFLLVNIGLWKQRAKLFLTEERNTFHFSARRGLVGDPLVPADVEARDHPGAHPDRHELKARHQKMRLQREIAIRRLNEVSLPNSLDFFRHHLLVGEMRTEVLDYRVGEHDIERSISVAAEITRVTRDTVEKRSRNGVSLQVENCNPDVIQVAQAHELPEFGGAPNVENANRAFDLAEQREEESEAPASHSRRKGTGCAIVCERFEY